MSDPGVEDPRFPYEDLLTRIESSQDESTDKSLSSDDASYGLSLGSLAEKAMKEIKADSLSDLASKISSDEMEDCARSSMVRIVGSTSHTQDEVPKMPKLLPRTLSPWRFRTRPR